MMRKIKVETSLPERLDAYLSRSLNTVSRSKLQKLIKLGEITVDGNAVPTKHLVKTGMTIEIHADLDAEPEPITPPPLPNILFEDDDVLVLNKPANLKVHASNDDDREPNLVHALLEARPEIRNVGDDRDIRPGLVHRLDRDASGVLIIAKTQKAFEHLKTQFKERRIKKIYTVLVYGDLPKDHDMIEFELSRGSTGAMVAHPKGSDKGRNAKTEYDVIKRFPTTTLVRVQIHTGRTHQIRVHFYAMQHPVVGDKLYKRAMKQINPIPLNRLFLHATELTIELPSGEETSFTAPLPEELEQVLASLSKHL